MYGAYPAALRQAWHRGLRTGLPLVVCLHIASERILSGT